MQQQIIIKNLLVSYSQKGEGVSVIFLHGWRSNKEVWNRLITDLENEKMSTCSLDLPGFGKSQTPKQEMTVGDYAEIVKEFCQKRGFGKVIVVGHSFGGRVGIKLASKYPELVNKLVLVDAAGFVMNEGKKNIAKNIAKVVKPLFKPKFMQGLRKGIYKAIGAEDYIATPELQKTFVNVTSEDLTEDMKKISCSTLIITGENDKDTPIDFGKKMNSLIPNSKFKILADAGHFSFLDKPKEFIDLIKEFIK